MIRLGSKVKDRITGFSGIVTGDVTYLSGCNHALVAPKVAADGTFKDAQWRSASFSTRCRDPSPHAMDRRRCHESARSSSQST
jgi:hypothetical protein